VQELTPANWFSADFDPDRAAKLKSWSFDAIIDGFLRCEIKPQSWEAATSDALKRKECHRACFTLFVDPDLYDAFFNAPAGYRGQFAKSEKHGEDAQRQLIEALLPRLMELAAQHWNAAPNHVMASLVGKQAKIWWDEDEADALVDDSGQLDFPLWARNPFNDPFHKGVRTPRGTKVEIKGGWVSANGEQVINPLKCHRSGNLTRTGHPG
jgi:hypothetical protein